MSVKVPFFIEHILFSPITVNNAVSTAPKELTFVYNGTPEFEQAARSMADECLLSYYNGVYYNLPGALMVVEFFSLLTVFQNKSKTSNYSSMSFAVPTLV